MSRLVHLYPAAWRERYEAEFMELLATRQPGVADRIDIVRGALDAHLHPQVRHPDEVRPAPLAESDGRLARRLGFGTLASAALWTVAWIVVLLGPVRYDDDGAYRDGAAAFPFLLGAVALIAGGLAGQFVMLPKDALLARFGAGLALLFTLVWGIQPWLLWAGVPMLGGLAILAVGGSGSCLAGLVQRIGRRGLCRRGRTDRVRDLDGHRSDGWWRSAHDRRDRLRSGLAGRGSHTPLAEIGLRVAASARASAPN